ncbi:hypothetical protein ACJX0J_039750, partial [Zea mays]
GQENFLQKLSLISIKLFSGDLPIFSLNFSVIIRLMTRLDIIFKQEKGGQIVGVAPHLLFCFGQAQEGGRTHLSIGSLPMYMILFEVLGGHLSHYIGLIHLDSPIKMKIFLWFCQVAPAIWHIVQICREYVLFVVKFELQVVKEFFTEACGMIGLLFLNYAMTASELKDNAKMN